MGPDVALLEKKAGVITFEVFCCVNVLGRVVNQFAKTVLPKHPGPPLPSRTLSSRTLPGNQMALVTKRP